MVLSADVVTIHCPLGLKITAQEQVSREDSTQRSGVDVTKIIFEEFFGVGVLGNTELSAAPCVDLPIRRTELPWFFKCLHDCSTTPKAAK